jgi:nitrogen regulatory protein P-II 1
MRETKAFIRLNMVNEVVVALRNAGFMSISLSQMEGTGKYTPQPVMCLFLIYQQSIIK